MTSASWFEANLCPWPTAKIGRHFEIRLGKMLQREPSTPSDREVPYLKAGLINWGAVRTEALPTMWAGPNDLDRYQVQPGDLVVSEGGDTGRAAFVPIVPEPTIIQNSLHRVRGRGGSTRFLYYLLRAMHGAGWLDIVCNKATIAHLTVEKLSGLSVPMPPHEMQLAIAHLLDRETERIDRLVEKKQRLIELLEEKRTALISHAVTKGLDPTVPMKDSGIPWLGEMPSHWRSLPLSRISYQITNGYVGPTRDILVTDGVPYIQSLHVKDGRVRHAQDYFVSRDWHLQHDRTRLRVGDVLLVQTGDIGQSAVVGPNVAGANCHALIITRIRPEVADPWFIGYLLRSEGGKGAVLATRTGATHPHLNVGYVRDVRFPVPPVEEQGEVARYLDQQVEISNRAVKKIRMQLDRLTEYRQALITAAVTGQIDVTDAAREPEEVVA